MKKFTLGILIIAGLYTCASSYKNMNNSDTTPVAGFELDRYLGKWYEIARFPNSFEKNLVGVTATYSLRSDGKVKVLNAGYKETFDGAFKTANGKAKFAADKQTGHLKVSFFLFFYGDYYILKLDKENYQWALVGGSTSDFLWILSRTPQMDNKIYQDLLDTAASRGYDLTKLEKVPQISE